MKKYPCYCKAHKCKILTDLYVVESLTKRLNEVVVQRLSARCTLLPNKYNSPISWVHNILSISTGDLVGKRQENNVALMKGSLLRSYDQVCRDILKQYRRIVVGPSQSSLGGLHGSARFSGRRAKNSGTENSHQVQSDSKQSMPRSVEPLVILVGCRFVMVLPIWTWKL